jgi:hypothetical protein
MSVGSFIGWTLFAVALGLVTGWLISGWVVLVLAVVWVLGVALLERRR